MGIIFVARMRKLEIVNDESSEKLFIKVTSAFWVQVTFLICS